MENNFKSIILLLTTQAMINLGEINDPVSNEKKINLDGASLFISLINVLKEKTEGNLEDSEEQFLEQVITNLSTILEKKKKADTIQ